MISLWLSLIPMDCFVYAPDIVKENSPTYVTVVTPVNAWYVNNCKIARLSRTYAYASLKGGVEVSF